MLLAAVVPLLLSSSFVLQLVLSSVNRKVPGELTVGSWLVGWRQGILCQQVAYHDPRQGVRITVPRVTTTRGILELAIAPGNLGRLIIDRPVVELAEVKRPPSEAAAPEKVPRSSPGPGTDRPFWDAINVDLHLRDGRVIIASRNEEAAGGLKNCAVDATLEEGVVTFDLSLHDLHNQGMIKAGGTLNLPASRYGWVDTMIADADLSIIELQVRDLLKLAGSRWDLPAGEGILTADGNLKAVGLEGMRVSGKADFRDLKLSGGFLGEDSPWFENIHLKVDDGHWSAKGWSVRQFDLVSDAVEMHGAGQLGSGEMMLGGRGSIHLPVLFDQFPRRLRVREAVFLEQGELEFAIDLRRSLEKTGIELTAGVENLGGLYDGRPFTWTSPLTVQLNGERDDRDARVSVLRLDAPFLQAEGRGDLNQFTLDAAADLEQAFAEVGRLFQLEWNGMGKAELTVNGRVFSLEDDRARIDADMRIDDFTLSRDGEEVVPVHDLSLTAGVQAPRSWMWEREGKLDLQLAMTTWLGEMFLAFNGEKPGDASLHGCYSTDASLLLEFVARLLQGRSIMTDEDALAGELEVQATGYLEGQSVEIRDLQSEIAGFVLKRNGRVFADDKIRLETRQQVNENIPRFAIRDLVVTDTREEFLRTGAGFNLIGVGDHRLFLRNLSLTAAAGEMTVNELVVHDWRAPLPGARVNLDGEFELGGLIPLLQGFGILAADDGLTGRGNMAVRTRDAGAGEREIEASLRLADFSFTRKNKKILSREEMRLDAGIHGLPDGGADIGSLRFQSRSLALTATGTLRQEEGRYDMELRGEAFPDAEQFGALLGRLFDIELSLAGLRSDPFHIRFPLAGGKGNPSTVTFAGGIQIDELRGAGLEARDLRMPVSRVDGKLRLEANGLLNGGRLDAVVEGDLITAPPMLKMPENSRVLTGVELREPLVDGVLSGIHPLFGVMAKPSGLLDARLDSFSWPLQVDGGSDAAFIVVFDVRNIQLDSDGILKELLTWFNLDKEKPALQDSEIYCAGQAGRIACSPVRLRIADAEMVVSGSVGLDRSLDYIVQVPLTRKLVSEGVYGALGETTVTVPIRGTISEPSFDGAMVTEAIRDVVRKAAVRVMDRQAEKTVPEGIVNPLGEIGIR
ncbi:MAG TPA: hypothetical protein ENN06_06435 [Desulfobacteraceae bacterium]|nr:hypothetical protein [Desulfobacteraceae bacterium]